MTLAPCEAVALRNVSTTWMRSAARLAAGRMVRRCANPIGSVIASIACDSSPS